MGTGEETGPKVGMNDANDVYLDDLASGVVGLTAGYSPLKEWSITLICEKEMYFLSGCDIQCIICCCEI